MLRVLTYEEVIALTDLSTFTTKLAFASRKPAWSADVTTSFYGKNIINWLHHLAVRHKALQGHRLCHCRDHPHGPGARAFYGVAGETHDQLLSRVRKLLPTSVWKQGIKINCKLSPIDAKLIQWNSCALVRLFNYLVSGSIPAHLKRNALL